MTKAQLLEKARTELAMAQVSGRDLTFIDRITALEKAIEIVITALEASK